MRIYLSGFMASGKSTVGRKLATLRNMTFLDLDDAVEEEAGKSIPEIFALEGELGFRQRETRALWDTAEMDDAVIALGGGTIVSEENRDWASEHGLVVTLKVSADEILERVADEASHRPLLQDDTGEPLDRPAMRQRIERMLSERRPAYEQVHATVDGERAPDTIAAVIDEIATVWRRREDLV
jgi:shikimate kinase